MRGAGDANRRPRGALSREGSYAAAIYGSILATGLIGGLRYTGDVASIAPTLISTSAVFWIAHVWAEVLGERIETGTATTRRRLARLAVEEWPMVEAGALPFLVLVGAWAGLYSGRAAIDIALGISIAQLVGWGLLGALRTGTGWAKGIVVGAVDGVFGLAIVGLEVLLH